MVTGGGEVRMEGGHVPCSQIAMPVLKIKLDFVGFIQTN